MTISLPRPPTTSEWLAIIQGEFREMPGLRLTKAEIQRLWGLDAAMCEALIETLEANRFLKRTARDAYVKADEAA